MRRGGTVSTAMVLLALAAFGVVLTVALYLVIGFIVGTVIYLLVRLLVRRSRLSPPAEVDQNVLPESMRDPAWAAALTEAADRRRQLIARCIALRNQYQRFGAFDRAYRTSAYMRAQEALHEVEKLAMKRFGRVPRARSGGEDGRPAYNVEIDLPHDEVIDVDRPFALVTDCRYGHCAEHAIVGLLDGQTGRRVVRECETCAPATRWTEVP